MRIEQVGPTLANTSITLDATVQSVAGKGLSAAISADGTRAYFGGHSGVWRSDDGGVSWSHPERPQPAPGQAVSGALIVPNVYDLAISPANNDIVFAATGNDARSPQKSGVYRSLDGAQSWTLVRQVMRIINGSPKIFQISQIAIAPDDPNLIFAAAGACILRSTDGGTTWTELTPTPSTDNDRFWHVVTGLRHLGERWVYVVGSRVWFSRSGGSVWQEDLVAKSKNLTLGPSTVVGVAADALTVHPNNPLSVFLTKSDFSVWQGTFFVLPVGASIWSQLASTPVIPNGPTDSGANFVIPHQAPNGEFFLISSDRRTVHIAQNLPNSESAWKRFEDGNCHCDPHALALTPDFFPAIAHGSPSSRGRAILINDGGAYLSTDGGHSWKHGKDIATLNVINLAVNPRGANAPPTLCFGGGDNSGFASSDGGGHWRTQDYVGGDNDCAFSDPLQPSRAIVFAPRAEGPDQVFREIFLYRGSGGDPPDLSAGTNVRIGIPGPVNLPVPAGSKKTAAWNAVSSFFFFGYRPIVLTVPGESPLPDGDTIVIRFRPGAAFLMRTLKLSKITSAADWASTATADGPNVKSFQVGPQLPVADMPVAQASGGHRATVFYVNDNVQPFNNGPPDGQMRLFKWREGMTAWQQIVPPPPPVVQTALGPGPVTPVAPQNARRFFVDPYRSSLLYVLSDSHVFRSENGGTSWVIDTSLENQLTQGGAFPFKVGFDENPFEALLRDMQFDPHRPGTRFAAGPAGVFATFNGVQWIPLLVAEAMALLPSSITYDYRSCPRVVYVSTLNSGLLRVGPIPPDWDYPMNSLQTAVGLITLLRVHDLQTGFGPPDDQLDAEVIVLLDTEPEKAFGFKLRADADRADANGKLKVLRDAFNQNRRVRLEFVRTGCRTGKIVRVIAQH
jgi:photosystem II stability/assembly factor-like uncharacterized protein